MLSSRVIALAALSAATLWGAVLLAPRAEAGSSRPAAKAPTASSELESKIAAQGKLISELQSRVSALEHASSSKGHSTTSGATSHIPMHIVPAPKSIIAKTISLGPSISSNRVLHLRFVGGFHKITPTEQLSWQVNAIAAQLAALQNEVSSDETASASQMTTINNNITTLTWDFNHLPRACSSNGAMTWSSWKDRIGDSLADNDLICFYAQ